MLRNRSIQRLKTDDIEYLCRNERDKIYQRISFCLAIPGFSSPPSVSCGPNAQSSILPLPCLRLVMISRQNHFHQKLFSKYWC